MYVCEISKTHLTQFEDFFFLPFVLGNIQVTAQWILRGQPLKTLEKQAPIYRHPFQHKTT